MATECKDSSKIPQFLKDIDVNLALYYEKMGIKYYFDVSTNQLLPVGFGKFSTYCINHKIHRKNIFINEELTENIEHCSFLEFDPDFPISNYLMKNKDKKKEIQWIIQHCYVYKHPPSTNKAIYINQITSPILPQNDSNSNTIQSSLITTPAVTKSNPDKAIDADLYLAKLSGITTWTCIQCTFKSPLNTNICSMCNTKKVTTYKETNQHIQHVQNAPKERVIKLLIKGFGRLLSDETGYELPIEIEKLFHSYYYLCAYWDRTKVFGYFKVSGFMNECIERTDNGFGSWQNMYSKQIICANGHYSWKLRVTDMTLITKAYGIVVGIVSVNRDNDTFNDELHRAFCFHKDGFGKQIDCEYIGQIINVDLDFNYTPTVALITINKYNKCLVPKFNITKKQIQTRNYKFALAMGSSGVTLEFFHFGYS